MSHLSVFIFPHPVNPYLGPGISVRLEAIVKRGPTTRGEIEIPVTPPKVKLCIRCNEAKYKSNANTEIKIT